MFNMRFPWFCPKPEHKFWQQPPSTLALSRPLVHPFCKRQPLPLSLPLPAHPPFPPIWCLCWLFVYAWAYLWLAVEVNFDKMGVARLRRDCTPSPHLPLPMSLLIIIPNWCWMEFFSVFRGERWQPAAGGSVANSEAACHMASVIFYCLTECCVWVCLGGLWQGGVFVLAKCCGWAWSWLT